MSSWRRSPLFDLALSVLFFSFFLYFVAIVVVFRRLLLSHFVHSSCSERRIAFDPAQLFDRRRQLMPRRDARLDFDSRGDNTSSSGAELLWVDVRWLFRRTSGRIFDQISPHPLGFYWVSVQVDWNRLDLVSLDDWLGLINSSFASFSSVFMCLSEFYCVSLGFPTFHKVCSGFYWRFM